MARRSWITVSIPPDTAQTANDSKSLSASANRAEILGHVVLHFLADHLGVQRIRLPASAHSGGVSLLTALEIINEHAQPASRLQSRARLAVPGTRSRSKGEPAEAASLRIIVELFREPGESGNAQFSCSLPDWNFMRELGRTFGWQPVGTTYLPQQGQRARDKPIKHDYQPGDSQDRKRVESTDSERWAAALDSARRSPFIAGMIRKQAELQDPGYASTEESLQALLQTFIGFARRGPFTISLRPAD